MRLWWHKACPGQYFLRQKPGGRGPAVGRVWRDERPGYGNGWFFHALYDTEEAHINFTERGQPKSVIALLEYRIRARFPEVEFSKENFK